jgi:hypothetical protein
MSDHRLCGRRVLHRNTGCVVRGGRSLHCAAGRSEQAARHRGGCIPKSGFSSFGGRISELKGCFRWKISGNIIEFGIRRRNAPTCWRLEFICRFSICRRPGPVVWENHFCSMIPLRLRFKSSSGMGRRFLPQQNSSEGIRIVLPFSFLRPFHSESFLPSSCDCSGCFWRLIDRNNDEEFPHDEMCPAGTGEVMPYTDEYEEHGIQEQDDPASHACRPLR